MLILLLLRVVLAWRWSILTSTCRRVFLRGWRSRRTSAISGCAKYSRRWPRRICCTKSLLALVGCTWKRVSAAPGRRRGSRSGAAASTTLSPPSPCKTSICASPDALVLIFFHLYQEFKNCFFLEKEGDGDSFLADQPVFVVQMDTISLYLQGVGPKVTELWRMAIKSSILKNGKTLKEQQLTPANVVLIVDLCTNFVTTNGRLQLHHKRNIPFYLIVFEWFLNYFLWTS